MQARPSLVDATHEDSGELVYIKEVQSDGEECQIAQLLIQEEWSGDPQNHCVRVKEIFKDPQDEGISYIVMPFLRPMDDPPFAYVKEIVDFADQILEVDAPSPSVGAPLTRMPTLGSSVPPRERDSSPVRLSPARFPVN